MEPTDNITGLSFLEKVILLALDDKGWFGNSENSIKFGLAGAILFVLFKNNRIELKEGVVVVKDPSPLNDQFLDRVLEFIKAGKKNRSIRTWIQRMVYKKITIRKSLIRSLIDKKILRKEEYSIFWVMYQLKYPVNNPELKKQLREEIFYRILKEERLDGYDLMMIAVMDSCKMFRKNFKQFPEYPGLRKRIKKVILFNDPLNEDSKTVGIIYNSIKRTIYSSNVSLHV